MFALPGHTEVHSKQKMVPDPAKATPADSDALRDLAAIRHVKLVEQLHALGSVKVEALAHHLGVTPQTIRGDLRMLDQQGLISRVRGGAVLRSTLDNIGYQSRQAIASDAKGRIGAAAATLVPAAVSVFINIGTTTEAVASHLVRHQRLMAVTNNLNVAEILADSKGVDVIVAGGRLRSEDRAIIGPLAVDFLSAFKVDYAIIGASAIDKSGSLLDFDIDEIKVSQSIVASARHVILVADSSKLARHAPVRFATMANIDTFVTDRLVDRDLAAICAREGVRVVETDRG
ncbi:DeoR faimly transcriptional regulator [Sphingobium sp. Ant17]|nr:DeoR faimly transcriptional regulator [Sphingobium sp. Ant17]